MVGSTPQALWIDTLKIFRLSDSEAVLKCDSEFHGSVAKSNASDILQAKFEKVLGHPIALHYILSSAQLLITQEELNNQ